MWVQMRNKTFIVTGLTYPSFGVYKWNFIFLLALSSVHKHIYENMAYFDLIIWLWEAFQ